MTTMKKGFLLDDSADTSTENRGKLRDARSEQSTWGGIRRNRTSGWGSNGSATGGSWGVESRSAGTGWGSNNSTEEASSALSSKNTTDTPPDKVKINNPFIGVPTIPPSADVPACGLQSWYAQHYKGVVFQSDNCFTVWDDGEKVKKFSAIFTCPVTRERFAAGEWGKEDYYEVREENVLQTGKTTKVVWYRNQKFATHAAAARTLDCFRHRKKHEEGDCNSLYRYGKDEPYLSGAGATLVPSCPLKFPDQTISTFDTSSPKNDLVSWCKTHSSLNFQLPKSFFTTWSDDNQRTDLQMFTSIFTCPLTGERFASGQWGKTLYEVRKECIEEGTSINIVWYPNKKLAIQATCARAIDCFRHRMVLLGSTAPLYNYAIDKPYLQACSAPPLPQCPVPLPTVPSVSFIAAFHLQDDTTTDMVIEQEGERERINKDYKKHRTLNEPVLSKDSGL